MDSALPRAIDDYLAVVRDRAILSADRRFPQVVRHPDGSFAPVVSVRDWMVLLIRTETERQQRTLEHERRAYHEPNAPA